MQLRGTGTVPLKVALSPSEHTLYDPKRFAAHVVETKAGFRAERFRQTSRCSNPVFREG